MKAGGDFEPAWPTFIGCLPNSSQYKPADYHFLGVALREEYPGLLSRLVKYLLSPEILNILFSSFFY